MPFAYCSESTLLLVVYSRVIGAWTCLGAPLYWRLISSKSKEEEEQEEEEQLEFEFDFKLEKEVYSILDLDVDLYYVEIRRRDRVILFRRIYVRYYVASLLPLQTHQ